MSPNQTRISTSENHAHRDAPVVLLSQVIGLPAHSHDGSSAGRIEDLTVRPNLAHPLVHRLLLRLARSTYCLRPWSTVTALTADGLTLSPASDPEEGGGVHSRRPPLGPDEVLLARDVMDTQVVDLQGRHLSRVSNVLLLPREDGFLEVLAADVGVAALLRRAGVGWLVGHGRSAAVDWQDLHLTSTRGHLVQLRTSTAGFRRLDAQALAELVTRLSTPSATDVLRTVDAERAAAAVHATHPHVGRRLMQALGPAETRRLVEAARADHARRLEELNRRLPLLRRRRFRRTAGWRLHRPGDQQPPSNPSNAQP